MPEGAAPARFSLVVALMSMGPISQQQLAEQMRVNRSLVVGIVDELERRGWLERRRDPDDRRSYRLHVTPAGERAVAEMRPEGPRREPRDGGAADGRGARAAPTSCCGS